MVDGAPALKDYRSTSHKRPPFLARAASEASDGSPAPPVPSKDSRSAPSPSMSAPPQRPSPVPSEASGGPLISYLDMFRTPLRPLSLSLSHSSEEDKPLAPPLSPTLSDVPSSPQSAMKPLSDDSDDRPPKSTQFEGDEPVVAVEHKQPKSTTGKKRRHYTKLSTTERHYLNKTFVYLQLQREWSSLAQMGTLAAYGPPFLAIPEGPNSRSAASLSRSKGLLGGLIGVGKNQESGGESFEREREVAESPVLRYMFWRFIKNAPVLRDAKDVYWTDQIQPFFDSFAERDLSTSVERGEVTKRRLLSMGLTRILGTYYSTCMTSAGRSVPSRPSVRIMRRVDFLLPGSMESMWHVEFPLDKVGYNAWAAIVGEEDGCFTIISRVLVTSARPEFFVLRTWPRFQSLAHALSLTDPSHSLDMPLLPPSLPLTSSSRPSTPTSSRSHTTHAPSLPPPRATLQRYLRSLIIALSTPPHDADPTILSAARIALEEFLLGQSRKVPKDELAGYFAQAKREDDQAEQQRCEWETIGKRTKVLRTTWALYKRALIETDEADKSIAIVRKTANLKDLPVSHRNAQEWVRIWVAYALHFLFVTSPTADETLALLKGFHDLIPYAALKLGLMLVNPTLAIRAVVAIVLGQPIGQMSLFQRIFSIVIGGGIKSAKKSVDALRKKLSNNSIANALQAHVYAPFATRAATRAAAGVAKEDILLTIVRDHASSADLALVDEWQQDHLLRAEESNKASAAVEDSTGAGRYQTLKSLLRAYCLKRDKEQVLAIALEHNTPVLLRSSISVWYDTIYAVANAANLAARLGDLQAFLDDLLTVAASSENDAAAFIALCARHEQSLYFFIHEVVSNGGTLIDPLLAWCKSGLALINEGLPSPSKRPTVSYDALLDTSSPERRASILQEMNDLALVTSYRKASADIALRADLLKASGSELVLDGKAMFADLLSQDGAVAEYFERTGERLGGSVGWAWWVESEGGERKKEKKETRTISLRGIEEIAQKARMGELPCPSVRATSELLEEFVERSRAALEGARKTGVV